MILLDTGYLVALARPTDELHTVALAWAAAVAEQLLVTHYVLVETVNALSRPAERDRAHELIRLITTDPHYELVPASDALLTAGLDLHRLHSDKEWSLTDCISFLIMRQRGLTRALAFDHHFQQAGFDPLLRRHPP